MTEARKKGQKRPEPDEYEIYHDSIGVMHFLPPRRCDSCEE